MATPGMVRALEGYDKLKARWANTRLKEHVKQERAYAAGSAVLGALLAGAADAKYRATDGTAKKVVGLPAVMVASGGLALLGITDLIPYGVYLGMAGVGGLCYGVGKAGFDHMTESMKEAADKTAGKTA